MLHVHHARVSGDTNAVDPDLFFAFGYLQFGDSGFLHQINQLFQFSKIHWANPYFVGTYAIAYASAYS